MKSVAAGFLMADSRSSVDPSKAPDELFELWSIPAYDRGAPDLVLGAEIGSQKQVVMPGDVLLSKIVPHIRRAWIVRPMSGAHRQIASGEWIVFRTSAADPAYLRHLLTSERFHAEFMATVSGVGGSLLALAPHTWPRSRFHFPRSSSGGLRKSWTRPTNCEPSAVPPSPT